jgi:hypothetical protein
MATHLLESPLPTLSDVMEVVLERVGPELARRGNRMIVDLVDSSTDTGRDLSPVADVIADVIDSASVSSQTKRNFVRVAYDDDQVVITVRDPVPDSGPPLAHRLTELHGSRVRCRSARTERGAEVIVQLPVPVSKLESGDRREFHHRATVARPLLKARAAQEARRRD